MCNFFVSLVAIYKFCLYYFPSTEPRVSKFVKDTNKIILLSTVLFVIKEISYPIVYFLQVPDIITKSQMQYLFAVCMENIFLLVFAFYRLPYLSRLGS